jgi:hypothetical protein
MINKILLTASRQLKNLDKKVTGAIRKLTPEQSITLADCIDQDWQNVRPVFILSTGRAGTRLLHHLLLLSKHAYSLHQPRPELIRVSKLAYESISEIPEIFEEVFRTAREELMLEAVKFNKIFIETNNRITFFAPIITKVFPQAVFIHLVRHPGDFVRSGVRRKWYSGSHEHDLGRIIPRSGQDKDRWSKMSKIEKIGWLWNETNQFIDEFRKTISPEKFIFVQSENLFNDKTICEEIYRFAQLPDFNAKKVSKLIKKPVNVQKKGSFPRYDDWTDEDKNQLRAVAPLATQFGYKL